LSGSAERRPLKILHIDPERNWGGGEAQVIGLLSYLAARGHENHLLADPAGQLNARSRNLNIERIPLIVRNHLDLRGVPDLRRRIGHEKYDVVHFHTKRAHVLSLWLPRGDGYPKYVVTRRMDYPEKSNWYTRCLYNRRVDGIIAISQRIVNILTAAGVESNRIRLIPSGIDIDRFADLPSSVATQAGAIVLGCLGILEERKGHRYLLNAVSLLQSRGVSVKCRIGGEGPLRAELEKQAGSSGLKGLVEFLGFVTDVPKFLACVDIFVMPSLYEGLGVAALEAMAAGKAVVASRIGGLAESIIDGETGLLVPSRDAIALADAIAKLAGAPEQRCEMGNKGKMRVRDHFTMELMAEKNEDFYYDLLAAT
jgi:glycosyltransferase involved in cell wall biosynthesis